MTIADAVRSCDKNRNGREIQKPRTEACVLVLNVDSVSALRPPRPRELLHADIRIDAYRGILRRNRRAPPGPMSSVGKLCGFSPQNGRQPGRCNETAARQSLPFTYWNLALAVSMLDLADRTNDAALRGYAESIVSRFVAADGSISGFPPTGFEHLQTIRREKYSFACTSAPAKSGIKGRTAGPRVDEFAPHDGEWCVRVASSPGLVGWPLVLAAVLRTVRPPLRETEIFDDIRRQYAAVFEHSRDPKTGLLHHGWMKSASSSGPIHRRGHPVLSGRARSAGMRCRSWMCWMKSPKDMPHALT